MVKGKTTRIDETKRYVRVRVKDPKHFQKKSFRTKDIGRKGFTKLIIGRPKGKTTTETQSILLSKKDFGLKGALKGAVAILELYPFGRPKKKLKKVI